MQSKPSSDPVSASGDDKQLEKRLVNLCLVASSSATKQRDPLRRVTALRRQYYEQLFPFELLARLFDPSIASHSAGDLDIDGAEKLAPTSKDSLMHREFAFRIRCGANRADPSQLWYDRPVAFVNADDMRQYVLRNNPVRIDVGAAYALPVPNLKYHLDSMARDLLSPKHRELVFDVDLSDYAHVERCGCASVGYCEACWRYAFVAALVIDNVLRVEYGYRHLLWVNSGRRGVHCWVFDARAARLSDKLRSHLLHFFNSVLPHCDASELSSPCDLPKNLAAYRKGVADARYAFEHPTMQRVYRSILLPYFERHLLPGRRLLTGSDRSLLLELFVHSELVGKRAAKLYHPTTGAAKRIGADEHLAYKRFCAKVLGETSDASSSSSSPPPVDREANEDLAAWRRLRALLGDEQAPSGGLSWNECALRRVVFRNAFPRIDSAVTESAKHLLKCPFSVHPDTLKLSLPFRVDSEKLVKLSSTRSHTAHRTERSRKAADAVQVSIAQQFVDMLRAGMVNLHNVSSFEPYTCPRTGVQLVPTATYKSSVALLERLLQELSPHAK